MKNLSQYIMYALLAIGALSFILVFTSDSYDFILYLTYAYFGVCIVVSLLGAVVGSLANPTGLKKSIIGIAGFAVICIIGYIMAGDEVPARFEDVSSTASKLSGAGLYVMYILSILAVGSIVFSSVSKMLK